VAIALKDVRAANDSGRADLARARRETRRRRTGAAGRPRSSAGVAARWDAYARTRDQQLRSELLAHYDGLAVSLAGKFRTFREQRDDLEQVARIGLIHAAERFDPSMGRPFEAFARSTISGELKRHLRDHGWPMRLPRSLHDCYLLVVGVMDDLTQELGRAPRISEVAARTGLSEDKVLEAMEVRLPLSLDLPQPDGQSLEPSEEDRLTERLEDGALLASLTAPLTERQRHVIQLHFVEGLSQLEIGRRLGVSQMCISRLLAKSMVQMRNYARAQAQEA
jgi:RNA polymerase sigma-B factor